MPIHAVQSPVRYPIDLAFPDATGGRDFRVEQHKGGRIGECLALEPLVVGTKSLAILLENNVQQEKAPPPVVFFDINQIGGFL